MDTEERNYEEGSDTVHIRATTVSKDEAIAYINRIDLERGEIVTLSLSLGDVYIVRREY